MQLNFCSRYDWWDSADCCVSINSDFCITLQCTQDSFISVLGPIVILRKKKFPKELHLLKYFVDSLDHHDNRWRWCKNGISLLSSKVVDTIHQYVEIFKKKKQYCHQICKWMGKGLKNFLQLLSVYQISPVLVKMSNHKIWIHSVEVHSTECHM